MLLRFSVSNFLSIRDTQELSLVAGPLSDDAGAVIQIDGLPFSLLRVAAIYGPNASGKTNMLLALKFMRDAVKNSQNKWEPGAEINRRRFALGDSTEKPTTLSIDFALQGIRYEYGFSVDDTRILEEYLFAFPGNRKQRWFERKHDQPQMFFGKNLPGENRAIANLTRPDSLFLSAAAQNNHDKLMPIFNWLANQLFYRSGLNKTSAQHTIDLCLKNEETQATVLRFLAAADLGIIGMEVKEEEPDPKSAAFTEKLLDLMKEFAPNAELDMDRKTRSVSFKHKGQDNRSVPIPLGHESAGTLAYLAMLGPIIEVLASGGVLMVDELDASLHPLLVNEIVRTFNRAETNPRGAQLIFNAHVTELLNDTLLRRDEIWFTEKDDIGATRLYPLSDFKPRKVENLQRGYLQGRYGGTPVLQTAYWEVGDAKS
jgi:uncharacterized protein